MRTGSRAWYKWLNIGVLPLFELGDSETEFFLSETGYYLPSATPAQKEAAWKEAKEQCMTSRLLMGQQVEATARVQAAARDQAAADAQLAPAAAPKMKKATAAKATAPAKPVGVAKKAAAQKVSKVAKPVTAAAAAKRRARRT